MSMQERLNGILGFDTVLALVRDFRVMIEVSSTTMRIYAGHYLCSLICCFDLKILKPCNPSIVKFLCWDHEMDVLQVLGLRFTSKLPRFNLACGRPNSSHLALFEL